MNRTLLSSICLALGLTFVLTIAGNCAETADWPGWRGPQRDGVSPATGLNWAWPAEGPAVRWRTNVGKGFSAFAVAGVRAYTLGNKDDQDTIYCFDAATGTQVWAHTYPAELTPLAYEGGPSSTPAVDAGRVYTLAKSGQAFCLDAATGAVIWQRKFTAPPTTKEDYKVWWGFAGSPLIHSGLAVFTVGNSGTALDPQTGAIRWESPAARPGYSSPVPFTLGGETCFALLSGHEIVAAKLATGQVLWKLPWRTTWDQNASDVVVADGQLLVATGHGVGGALYDLAATPPKQVWRRKDLRNELATAVRYQGGLFGYDAKQLVCLDWATGERRWAGEETGQGTLLAADGKLITLIEDGTLQIVNADTNACQVVARAKVLSGRCWTAPALANGRLYLRNASGEVVCLDLQKR